jgi:uncharacterized membrane protein YhhN
LWTIALAAPLLIALLFSERRELSAWILATKTPLSGLFVLTAVMRPHAPGTYFSFLLFGLLCCLAGDICLAFRERRMFLAGLFAFLCGHVMYLFGFIALSGITAWGILGLLAAVPIAWRVYCWLSPHLGVMRLPVILYIAAISLMVAAASGVAGDQQMPERLRLFVPCGALSFYLSDIFVARQRFVTPSFFNRLAGLPLYYLGQFLLALSPGYA